MNSQLSFEGFAAPQHPTDRLFFAIFPDADTAARIARLARQFCDRHELKGPPLEAERFHITLHHLGDYVGVPRGTVAAAVESAQAVSTAPFDLVFDRVASFQGRPGNRPLILRGGGGVAALAAFQRDLGVAMTKGGLGRKAERNFTPHMTLLYDDHEIDEPLAEPIGWTAREFVLVHSLLGQTRHIPLARWKFSDRLVPMENNT